eukprot:GFUD01000760.1.p1 GENE.GFUD01000760.1~~GFUD01000760.1.p1  ORF type:complete len:673 (+),score=173.45 GFUD01000760.1:46-2064(+)
MDNSKNWKIINDKNKKTLRISSFESDNNVSKGVEKLPFDIEIFQNLVDNICRKFDIENGENLLCFGGCAIFNSDGSLKCVENFLPKYPSLIKNWLTINKCILNGFLDSSNEKLSLTDPEIRKNIWESVLDSKREGENLDSVRIEPSFAPTDSDESHFLVTIPARNKIVETQMKTSQTENNVINASKTSQTTQNGDKEVVISEPVTVKELNEMSIEPKKSKIPKFKLKYGTPLPPKPVLCLNQEEIKIWFPQFIEKMSGKKFPTSMPKKFPDWDADVDKVLTHKDFVEMGPKNEFNWKKVSPTFYWKLKLVSAIILDKKGIDYTTFAENVEEKHEKYSINDLKLMSMSKNPETFEKLFVKNAAQTKKCGKPAYLDEFEKKSSEIILQNFRLINARDKKLNGNNVQKSVLKKSSEPPPRLVPIAPKPPEMDITQLPTLKTPKTPKTTKSTIPPAVNGSDDKKETKTANKIAEGIKVTPLSETNDFISQDLEPPKSKRKKSSDSAKDDKNSKLPNQRFLCKNNFQKGDFLIHPSQLYGKYGPVKLVTYRRETKKVFLSISEFETKESEGDFVILEKSSHKNRSTPAKFLDSYVKINEYIEVVDKSSEKMKLKRSIPKIDAFPNCPEINATQEGLEKIKHEIIDLDELVNDEAFDEELDELDELEDSEMVIDETNS